MRRSGGRFGRSAATSVTDLGTPFLLVARARPLKVPPIQIGVSKFTAFHHFNACGEVPDLDFSFAALYENSCSRCELSSMRQRQDDLIEYLVKEPLVSIALDAIINRDLELLCAPKIFFDHSVVPVAIKAFVSKLSVNSWSASQVGGTSIAISASRGGSPFRVLDCAFVCNTLI